MTEVPKALVSSVLAVFDAIMTQVPNALVPSVLAVFDTIMTQVPKALVSSVHVPLPVEATKRVQGKTAGTKGIKTLSVTVNNFCTSVEVGFSMMSMSKGAVAGCRFRSSAASSRHISTCASQCHQTFPSHHA